MSESLTSIPSFEYTANPKGRKKSDNSNSGQHVAKKTSGEINKASSEFVQGGGLHHRAWNIRAPKDHTTHLQTSDSAEELIPNDDYDHVDAEQSKSASIASIIRRKHEERENLEVWWILSPTWRRTTVFMCIIMLLLTILHAGLALYHLSTAFTQEVEDPYVCRTMGCVEIANWAVDSIDEDVDPCDNFYKYVCGRHVDEDDTADYVPGIENIFRQARNQFHGHTRMAEILKPSPQNSDVLIPFYKACLDTRRRNRRNLDVFAEIINETYRDKFRNIDEFNTLESGGIISRIIGRYGFFGFQLLHQRHIAFLPPAQWVAEMKEDFNNTENYDSLKNEALPKLFKLIWERLKLGDTSNSYDAAANYFLEYMNVLWTVNFSESCVASVNVSARVSKILEHAFGPDYILDKLEIISKEYTRQNLEQYICAINTAMKRPNINRAVFAFGIYNLLEYFALDFRGSATKDLGIHFLFPEKRKSYGISEERYCFDSMLHYLKSYAIIRAFKFDSTKEQNALTEATREDVRRIRRAFRKLADPVLKPLMANHHYYLTKHFASHEDTIIVNFPYAITGDVSTLQEDQSKFFESFQPGPDHLRNIYELSKLHQNWLFNAWKQNNTEQLLREIYSLERNFQKTDNQFEYENNMYPAISLFGPLFSSFDLRVFRVAGATNFLAGSFIKLWSENMDLMHKHKHGPLKKLLSVPEFLELEKQDDEDVIAKKNYLRCLGDSNSSFSRRKDEKLSDFVNDLMMLHALAFKISLEILQNPSLYESLRDKTTKELYPNIEPVFDSTESVEYRDVKTGESVDRSNFLGFDEINPHKLRFKKAPGKLETFSEAQVFFITSVRHHCYDPLHTEEKWKIDDIEKVLNAALGQLQEFSEAWNCPAKAPMNPEHKCF